MVTKTALRNRYKRNLRKAGIKRQDSILVATLPNLQSKASLDLLVDIEKEFQVKISHIHIGRNIPQEINQLAQKLPGIETIAIDAEPATYTQLKLKILEKASPHQLVVLPLTAEEIATYFLDELIRGNIEGLKLEARHRTAYPLATTTINELQAVYKQDTLPPATLYMSKLLEWLAGTVNPQALAKFYIDTYASRSIA
ncbi:MAG: hypothetical protein QXX32_05845 [Thermofilum sp.]|jgi:hypothetical protein|uniref:Uncharacterized protein n=2 Tax=Thermofilaceae TaxID=114378 RepID=S5ZDB2_9CREN|nr:hypothetical protein [Thermofilum adornatum]AGT34983.1 hypothetical protein N186_03040 [Thermofilum adornatum]MCC5990377.1 hypothetical protein [Thermosphaera sp.]NAZ24948.1 hypothetical protein [Thermofilum sp.]